MYEDDVVFAGDFFPVGLWLGEQTCLVREDKSPDPSVVAALIADLEARGCKPILLAEDLQAAVLSLTMTKVQTINANWTVWSLDEPTARASASRTAPSAASSWVRPTNHASNCDGGG